MEYRFRDIEKKWQKYWKDHSSFKTNTFSNKEPFYCLDMFPYPSGAGLHVGHPEGYTATDILCRFKRMEGFEVLHPMGWDAFGLPAERYAMQTGIHPRETTISNTNNFRSQIQAIGLSYDWDREISTTDPSYFRFTQWIFLQIYNSYYNRSENKAKPISQLIEIFEKNGSMPFESEEISSEQGFTAEEWSNFSPGRKDEILSLFRLVYLAYIPVNWCEGLGTVLANEEVEEWISKGYTVERRPMKQYMMRITAYAERLLQDLNLCEWPTSTLEMQKNWIGRSRGLELDFPFAKKVENLPSSEQNIRVFTTRPDTIFGATYMVLAPEHSLVNHITEDKYKDAIETYRKETSLKSDMDRTSLNKDKTGIFTGAYCLNPADPNKKIPIYISDYVLASYGTGAIMAVPAHDQRDFEFAKKYNIEIISVILDPTKTDLSNKDRSTTSSLKDKKGTNDNTETVEQVFDSKESLCINSNSSELELNGLKYEEAFSKVSYWAETKKIGKSKIQFKLRDWLFARQRYWGEPIPLVHYPDGTTRPIPDSELPLELPELSEFKPSGTGESPLALAKDWLTYKDPITGMIGTRETNTMPQWAGSCWYYLRYIDPTNTKYLCDPELEKKWMPVGVYVGGAEHAVLHLLYSRFWHKILFDLGHVTTSEPFQKLIHQGLILGEDKRKMSKSLGNVVNPDKVVEDFGADSLRLFEMFMGPFEMVKPWSTKGVEGVFRFLGRVWRLFHQGQDESFRVDEIEPTDSEWKILHKSIHKLRLDITSFSFNTAISQMMIFVNELTPTDRRPRKILEPFVLLLSPFAPHIAEELWNLLGHQECLVYEKFPIADPKYLVDDEITFPIQVNGKLRGEILVKVDISQADLEFLAQSHEKVKPFLEGKTIRKVIFVPGKILNYVVS
jgi:leucyl-tRNA synthetase